MTVKEAARKLEVSVPQLRKWMRDDTIIIGHVTTCGSKHKYIIHEPWLELYLEGNPVTRQ